MKQFEGIRLHQTGGFIGSDRLTMISRSELSKIDQERLDQAVEALRFFDVAQTTDWGGISDAITYDLTIEKNGRKYSVRSQRPPDDSVAFLALVKLIQEFKQGSAPTA